MREFAWIEKLAGLFGRQAAGAPVGIGDDCAVLDGAAPTLVSIDTVVEGVHFDRGIMSPADIGWRALAVALSDLAACGADPRRSIQALVSLQWPPDWNDDAMAELAAGLRDCASAHGCAIVGGDTVSTPGPLALTLTVIGGAARPVLRRGARVGDAVVVTGPLGASGVGLAALRAGLADDDARACGAAYRRPRAQLADGARLAALASAMIDISDGLLQDLGHLCEASGVGADVDLDLAPIDEATRGAAAKLGLDPVAVAAGAGDDYQLLATVAPRDLAELRRTLPHATVIGATRPGAGVAATRAGRPYEPPQRGYEHGT